MTDDAHPSRTQRDADGHFARPHRASRQHQIGYIDAGQNEEERCSRKDDDQKHCGGKGKSIVGSSDVFAGD